jgi:UDP-N-acetylglucosamine/UDP-N-acetylgalactosamine diphosphorylase
MMNDNDQESTTVLRRSRFEAAGQGHVFDHCNEKLSAEEQRAFLRELATIPVETLPSLLLKASSTSTDGGDNIIRPFSGTVAHSPTTAAVATTATTTDAQISSTAEGTKILNSHHQRVGLRAIAQGHVAALVLAGGQGTRLGFDGPKGLYDIGLPSHRSLFELIALRLKKLSQLASTCINNCGDGSGSSSREQSVPFYIMTSPLNHEETFLYFQSKDNFGLGEENVFFFRQGMLPCLTEEGKIILEGAGRVAMAPDGNGGIYPSLQASGALQNMLDRGIRYLHVFSIDNALVKPADPVFVGYCIDQKADCGNKVVWKSNPHEKVGVIAERNGRPCIVEYSEISKEMAEQTDADGRLVYGAGNICNHFYTVTFLRDTILPNMGNLYHVAHKKIPYYDAALDKTVTPESNNGIKLETFIFDVFPLAQNMAVMDVEREEEFAPVKNEPGSHCDSPDTARTMMSELAKRWVRAAGGTLLAGGDDDDDDAPTKNSLVCEISPLTSYSGEGLEALVKGREISCPFLL